tara:strand:- start:72 stop:314 length:243 start_codon:yes stop_codon:yes gene_type:complete
MQGEPLNTLALQQFIQQVKSAEASNAREIKMPIAQAKNLSFTLGIVMSRLVSDLEKVLVNTSSKTEEIEVRLDGGSGFNN